MNLPEGSEASGGMEQHGREFLSMAKAPTSSRSPLLVFAEDWGRHSSSCQHLIPLLLDRHDVYWINTIGTRRPSLNLHTVRRALEKARHWLLRRPASTPLPDHLRVVSPIMWPYFTTAFDRQLNLRLLQRRLARLVRSLPEPPIAITKIPIVADLMGVLPVKHWVYYCVDDFSQWPGLDQPTLERMEEIVVQRADRLICVSEVLQERLARMGRSARLLTHGVDLDFWRDAVKGEPLPGLAGLERPLVAFWGMIDPRMDVAFVRRLATKLTHGSIILAGPEADVDPALISCPRVVRLGPLRFAELPRLGGEADVIIMPYIDHPVTRAMQPLKLKEYLATGKPAVVRDLPATRAWADCLDLADTPETFARTVLLRLTTGLPPPQEHARKRLSGESWSEKAQIFERWVMEK
jgi:glycosyltransferase involved in cell wall biosynthesis